MLNTHKSACRLGLGVVLLAMAGPQFALAQALPTAGHPTADAPVTSVNEVPVVAQAATAQANGATAPTASTISVAPGTAVLGKPFAPLGMRQWLGEPPSANDAAGRVVLHWFCAAKNKVCKDDLARVMTLRENGKVYVVAYIAGGKRDAQKLDPVRDAVGAGAVAFGPAVVKAMGLNGFGLGPASVILGVDGNVAHIENGGEPDILDEREAKIAELGNAIKDFSVAVAGPKGSIKAGERFELKVTLELAPWLAFNRKAVTEYALTVAPDFVCDAKKIGADKMQIDGKRLVASIGCVVNGKGSYEARATYRFGYDHPAGTTAMGTDSVGWKFDVVAP